MEVLDSRGNPTVKVFVETKKGVFSAIVPSGASTGETEAVELRDGGERFFGKGVRKAVSNINNIIGPKLKGMSSLKQREIDEAMVELDGTENKSNLGANAILAVSMAVSRAGAAKEKMPLFLYLNNLLNEIDTEKKIEMSLPYPSFNIINGGAHAGNNLDIQEFMIIPQAEEVSERVRIASEIYHQLKIILSIDFGKQATNLGDEGGFAPMIKKPEEAVELIKKAVEKSGYNGKVMIAIDAAASQFYKKNKYSFMGENLSNLQLTDYYLDLIKESKLDFAFIEDPFDEKDWPSWQWLMKEFKKREIAIPIIGDDLLTTNPSRMKMAEEKKACNGMIIKPNQIGSVSEAMKAAVLAKKYGWVIVASHRSGDSCDSFISDFAVAVGANYIKSGAPARGERTSKYNRLMEIESEVDFNVD